MDAVAATWDVFAARHKEVEQFSEMNSGPVAFERLRKANKIVDAASEALKTLLGKMTERAAASADPKDFQAVLTVKEAEVTMLLIQRTIRNLILSMVDPAMQQEYEKQMDVRRSALLRQIELAAAAVPATEQATFKIYGDEIAKWLVEVDAARKAALENGTYKAVAVTNGAGRDALRASRESINKVIELNNEQMQQAAKGADDL